jgi:hypothetical protein
MASFFQRLHVFSCTSRARKVFWQQNQRSRASADDREVVPPETYAKVRVQRFHGLEGQWKLGGANHR